MMQKSRFALGFSVSRLISRFSSAVPTQTLDGYVAAIGNHVNRIRQCRTRGGGYATVCTEQSTAMAVIKELSKAGNKRTALEQSIVLHRAAFDYERELTAVLGLTKLLAKTPDLALLHLVRNSLPLMTPYTRQQSPLSALIKQWHAIAIPTADDQKHVVAEANTLVADASQSSNVEQAIGHARKALAIQQVYHESASLKTGALLLQLYKQQPAAENDIENVSNYLTQCAMRGIGNIAP